MGNREQQHLNHAKYILSIFVIITLSSNYIKQQQERREYLCVYKMNEVESFLIHKLYLNYLINVLDCCMSMLAELRNVRAKFPYCEA